MKNVDVYWELNGSIHMSCISENTSAEELIRMVEKDIPEDAYITMIADSDTNIIIWEM